MSSAHLLRLVALVTMLPACFDPAVGDAAVGCRDEVDCPQGSACPLSLGRCVPVDLGAPLPELLDVVIDPTVVVPGDEATIRLVTTALAAPPRVRVGTTLVTMAGVGDDTYEGRSAVTGADGDRAVTVDLVSASGQEVLDLDAGVVRVDGRGPRLVDVFVDYDPPIVGDPFEEEGIPSVALNSPPPRGAVTRTKPAQINLTFAEPVFEVSASGAGLVVAGAPSVPPSENVALRVVVGGDVEVDGDDVSVTVVAADALGNATESVVIVAADTVRPAPMDPTAIRLIRQPWGTSLGTTTTSAQVEIVGVDRLSLPRPFTVVIAASDGSAPATEIGRRTFVEVPSESGVPSPDTTVIELGVDVNAARVVVVDAGGNIGLPTEIDSVSITASLQGKIPGRLVENPHAVTLVGGPIDGAAVSVGRRFGTREASGVELGRQDGVAAIGTAQGMFRPVHTFRPTGTVSVVDPLRGGVGVAGIRVLDNATLLPSEFMRDGVGFARLPVNDADNDEPFSVAALAFERQTGSWVAASPAAPHLWRYGLDDDWREVPVDLEDDGEATSPPLALAADPASGEVIVFHGQRVARLDGDVLVDEAPLPVQLSRLAATAVDACCVVAFGVTTQRDVVALKRIDDGWQQHVLGVSPVSKPTLSVAPSLDGQGALVLLDASLSRFRDDSLVPIVTDELLLGTAVGLDPFNGQELAIGAGGALRIDATGLTNLSLGRSATILATFGEQVFVNPATGLAQPGETPVAIVDENSVGTADPYVYDAVAGRLVGSDLSFIDVDTGLVSKLPGQASSNIIMPAPNGDGVIVIDRVTAGARRLRGTAFDVIGGRAPTVVVSAPTIDPDSGCVFFISLGQPGMVCDDDFVEVPSPPEAGAVFLPGTPPTMIAMDCSPFSGSCTAARLYTLDGALWSARGDVLMPSTGRVNVPSFVVDTPQGHTIMSFNGERSAFVRPAHTSAVVRVDLGAANVDTNDVLTLVHVEARTAPGSCPTAVETLSSRGFVRRPVSVDIDVSVDVVDDDAIAQMRVADNLWLRLTSSCDAPLALDALDITMVVKPSP